jgi:hypothetical protein
MSLRRQCLTLFVFGAAIATQSFVGATEYWQWQSLDQPNVCYQDCQAMCSDGGYDYEGPCNSVCGGASRVRIAGCGVLIFGQEPVDGACQMYCDCQDLA